MVSFLEKCLKTHLRSDETAHSVEQQEAHGRSDLESLLEGPLLEIKCSAYIWTIQAFIRAFLCLDLIILSEN